MSFTNSLIASDGHRRGRIHRHFDIRGVLTSFVIRTHHRVGRGFVRCCQHRVHRMGDKSRGRLPTVGSGTGYRKERGITKTDGRVGRDQLGLRIHRQIQCRDAVASRSGLRSVSISACRRKIFVAETERGSLTDFLVNLATAIVRHRQRQRHNTVAILGSVQILRVGILSR